ncbi:hypothetical protein [Bradyrhizobium sp. DASA03007]|uniref:hypothetical protein n=1 Tax=unclassified Bradyrhizobium TaxID=2631580 RepID=UPI003F72E8BC
MSFTERHPYNSEPLPANVRLLIVGTAPPPRFSNPQCEGVRAHKLDFSFFYGSGHNSMWLWLNKIAADQGRALPNDEASAQEYGEAAREFLRRNRLWMKDVLQSYRRKTGRECSSADDDIITPLLGECVNFAEVLVQHPSIEALAFTSHRAFEWSLMAMGQSARLRVYRERLRNDRTIDGIQPFDRIKIGDREAKFFLLPSPSGRAFSNCEAINIYRTVLFGPAGG